jgi:coenzyme F420-reducing hydrogenase alpha subunit
LFLVAPDLLGVGSVFPLVATHPEVVKAALRLKALANDVGTLVSGRAVHPVSCVPGGFTSFPGASALRAVKAQIEGEGMRDLALAVEVVASLAGRVPAFARENEYISLKSGAEYAFYDGDICSSDAGTVPVAQYREVTNEHIVPHSTAKHCRFHRSSYMVGALARWNNNYRQINGSGRAVAEKLGFSGPSNNPFANTVAQVVETAHCVEEALRILDLLLTRGLEEEKPNQSPTRYGQGVGATEVPRGVLFHDYTYDRRGLIEKANCIIPTNQNFASMDDDLKKLVPELVELPEKELTHRLEMLIRAYDPCISCAVHVVRV